MDRVTAWLLGLLVGCTATPREEASVARVHGPIAHGEALRVLLFSRTTGFRHDSIAVAVPAVQQLGDARGWTVDATEDPTVFTAENLAQYDVVVFMLTTGDVLDEAQQSAFEGWLALQRGYVGVHSASDTEYDWAWYGAMLGGYFTDHPAPQEATVHVVDGMHPSTEHLSEPWVRFDEWYNFAPNPSATVDVLLRLDETTYSGGTMGDDHPIAWAHEYGGGRAFYTGGGHTDESWAEADFLAHVMGGIAWAAGDEEVPGTSSGEGSGGTTTTTTTTITSTTTANTTSTSTSTSTSASTSTSTSTSAVADGTDDSDQRESASGCGCNTGPHASAWLLLLLAIRRTTRAPRRARDPDVYARRAATPRSL
jgi:type 1 glutamine amidotransferase